MDLVVLEAISGRLAVDRADDSQDLDDARVLLAEVRRLRDLAAPFQPGQPDPTPPWNRHHPQCGVDNPEGMTRVGSAVAYCTWPAGHPAEWSHVAGSSAGVIVAVW